MMSVDLLPSLLLLLLIIITVLLPSTNAEYREFDGVIQAAASYIHYSEGYVIAPGSIDISDLVFSTIDNSGPTSKTKNNAQSSSSSYSSGTDSGDSTGIPKEYTDDVEAEDAWNDDDDTGGLKVGEDDDNRQLSSTRQLAAVNNNNGGGGAGSFVDIVIFHEVMYSTFYNCYFVGMLLKNVLTPHRPQHNNNNK